MAWTNVSKPTSSVYARINTIGKEQYDQSDITYDSATVFYDGVNQSAWTSVAKPTSSVWTSIAKPT